MSDFFNFSISSLDIITAPEIEMLIIINENKYNEYNAPIITKATTTSTYIPLLVESFFIYLKTETINMMVLTIVYWLIEI